MRGIRLILFAALLAPVFVADTADSSGPADPCGVEELPVSTEAAGFADDEERQASAGIAITMTGEAIEDSDAWASVMLEQEAQYAKVINRAISLFP